MDSERIILGSGKLYCMVFTGEIPADTAIETDANQLAHIKGGASLEYTAETYTAKDDLGVVQKTILNNKYYTYTANSKNNSTSTSGSSGLKQTQKPESALCFDKTLAGAYVVTADKLHMRAGAGKTKADYGTIAEGGKVHCYGYYNKEKGTGAKWLYVACGNVTGYCHSDYLKRA